MIRKRTLKEFDLAQVRLPNNQKSGEHNSRSLTYSPPPIPSPGALGRKADMLGSHVRLTRKRTSVCGSIRCFRNGTEIRNRRPRGKVSMTALPLKADGQTERLV